MSIYTIINCITVTYPGGKMKKIIALFVVFVCVGAALSAQISFGGGTLVDYIGNNAGAKMTFSAELKKDFPDEAIDMSEVENALGVGGFAFLDLMYAEINMDFSYGIHSYVLKFGDEKETGDLGTSLNLGFSLLGKYPFDLGPVTLYPMAGLGYNIVLARMDEKGNNYKDSEEYKDSDRSVTGDYSQFFLMAGAGLDYNINRNIYLRFQTLFQMRLAPKGVRDAISEIEKMYKDEEIEGITMSSTLGIGPRIKVGIGFRL
jgi:opacity protein-like surface antigen